MHEPYLLFATLIATIALFILNVWRYDIVACLALFTLVITGIIPFSDAFTGFSSPAVITVACVMIITRAITESGVIDYFINQISSLTNHTILHLGILVILTAVLSAFMNNVGALALMMPVAIQTAINNNRSPALVLMPVSFGSVLGGLTTAIGTPPNLIISAFREQTIGHPFAMFDFSPVGLIVAISAVAFIILVGWRLLPYTRKTPARAEDMFNIQNYISEVKIPKDSPFIDKSIKEIQDEIETDFNIVGLIRSKRKQSSIPHTEILQEKDILIIQASHEDLQKLIQAGNLELVGGDIITAESLRGGNIVITEAVVPQGARIEGRSWQRMRIRNRFQINLLAIARQGKAFRTRLNNVNLRAGDVVLLQGDTETMPENIRNLGFLPLIERGVQVGIRRKAFLPLVIFAFFIALTATRIVPVQIAFSLAVLVLVMSNIIPARKIYGCVDWSIIVLLAAMIPIGGAMQATGTTKLIADAFINLAGNLPPVYILGSLMLLTMTLSDIMNNVATAVVMAPIAITIAQTMQVSVDPFLMTVAVGASCSFLTPISHQNNMLVMGPGGYKFFDYFRLGLPVELIVLLTGIPTIMWMWPI